MASTTRRFADIAEIEAWLSTHVAVELHMDAADIDARKPLVAYGLDSLTAVGLAGELERWLDRPLPDTLLSDHETIAAVARHLALEAPAPACPAATAVPASTGVSLDCRSWSPVERTAQRLAFRLARAVASIEVEGRELVPPSGPLLLACNHLHILDALWMFSALPRRAVFVVAEQFRRMPFVGQLLSLGRPIYIARGTGDRRAIDAALAVLRAGGAVVVAPEGRISRTGGLLRGHTGIARLAVEAPAPVVPAVMWGQERAASCWRSLQRVPIRVRFGAPVTVPSGRATAKQLERYTDRIMLELARHLPPAYRGVYATSLD